jgi:hypothetical protein
MGRRHLKLSPHQIAVFCLLLNKEKDGKAELSTASMAGLLGVDVRTESAGWWSYARKGRRSGFGP